MELKSQDIDLENIDKNRVKAIIKSPLKITGGISANNIFYYSNSYNNRAPLTYFLNGNLNIGFYQWSLPISYSLTNQGSTLGYQLPYKFNRISMHPKYKWIRGHIGDISMIFSPYTFNGLQFTGGGVELTPGIPLKIALFSGRLNKAIKDDGDPRTIPAFLRYGHGLQLKWEKARYKLGFIGFYAKDILKSLDQVPENKNILPQENISLSLNASVYVMKNVELFGEVARSSITNDLRAAIFQKKKDVTSLFLQENSTTEFYNACNAGINFGFANGFIGIRYERIDPGYRTLGAYYFNNDMENITLNTNLNLFRSRLSLSGNVGQQKDNLGLQKLKQTNRWVGAINANWKASEQLIIAATYSNFTMFTNNQLNQFSNINQNPLSLQQPKDTINYKQIAQNANVNINYIISQNGNFSQNLNANYSLNDMVNRENNIVRKSGIARFHNTSLNYSLGLSKIKLNITTSLNYTYTYAASQIMHIWGPSLNATKTLINDKLQLSLGASYNRSDLLIAKIDVTNFRFSANYTPWKRHNFNTNIIQMIRSSTQINQQSISELTATIGYAYNF